MTPLVLQNCQRTASLCYIEVVEFEGGEMELVTLFVGELAANSENFVC